MYILNIGVLLKLCRVGLPYYEIQYFGSNSDVRMKLIWQNAFEKVVYENQHAELFAFYDESLKKTSFSRLEFFSLVSRFAAILRAGGVEKGDIIVCALPVCPETAVVNYGAIFAGAAVINCMSTPENPVLFSHCVKESTAKYIVMRTDSFDPTWQEVKDKVTGQAKPGTMFVPFSDTNMPNVTKAILINRGGEKDFLTYVKSSGGCLVDRAISEDDLAFMYLTSGTTGFPKLVMRAHKSLVLDAKTGILPKGVAPEGANRRFFHIAPWSWAVSSSFDILDGYTRVQPDFWQPAKDIMGMTTNIIKKDGVRWMFLTPPELKGVLALWGDSSKKVADGLLIAGFPVTKEMCKWLLTACSTICVRFGCSEMISVSYNVIRKVDDFQDFDTGLIYDGTIAKMVNEDMEELPLGTPGRLLLKSDSMFVGYMGQPEKTAEALNDKGWFVTTDAAYIDHRQHLFIIGRYDYVIKHKGVQYYPSFIEKAIVDHPQVKDVLVVPVPNKQNHHDVFAYVVLEDGSKLTENDVIKFVANSATKATNAGKLIAPQHVRFSPIIERNARGKINRNQMIENAVQMIKG